MCQTGGCWAKEPAPCVQIMPRAWAEPAAPGCVLAEATQLWVVLGSMGSECLPHPHSSSCPSFCSWEQLGGQYRSQPEGSRVEQRGLLHLVLQRLVPQSKRLSPHPWLLPCSDPICWLLPLWPPACCLTQQAGGSHRASTLLCPRPPMLVPEIPQLESLSLPGPLNSCPVGVVAFPAIPTSHLTLPWTPPSSRPFQCGKRTLLPLGDVC